MRSSRASAVLALTVVPIALVLTPARHNAVAWLRTHELISMVPALDRALAWHLESDSRSDWAVYSRHVGARPLMDGYTAIYRSLNQCSYAQFVRERAPLERVMLQVCLSLESDYGVSGRKCRALVASSTRDDYEAHRFNRRYAEVMVDASLTPRARIATLDSLIALAPSSGNEDAVQDLQFSAATIESDLGRSDRYRERLELALAEARENQDDYLACQILGGLAFALQAAGKRDSFQVCIDQGVALALRRRFPDQAARLLFFDARHALEHGRLSLAADRLNEALYACESFGGGSARVRLVIEYAQFLEDLGCWDAASRTLRRLPPLLREFPSRSEPNEAIKFRFDADHLIARAAFARGDVREGQRLTAPWVAAMPAWNRRVGLALVFKTWSWGLQHAGHPAEALAVCERGLAHCDSANVPDFAITLALRRARLLEALNHLDQAERAAQDAARRLAAEGDPGDPANDALQVMRARLLLREGRIAAGRDLLRAEFRSMRRRASLFDPRDAIELDDLEGLSLRDAVHELAGLSPAARYGFELEWRSLSRETGGDFEASASRGAADPFSEVAFPGRGTNLLFHFMDGRVLRWTADERGVVLDTLALSTEACLADVREALALMQTERANPSACWGPRTRRALRRLSLALLPDSLASGASRPTRIEISPDGPLSALPFEALPIRGPRGEAPLAACADVAYFEGWSREPRPAERPPVILSDPAVPRELARRYVWTDSLAGSDAESRSAHVHWPGALVLSGADATKHAFERSATGAPYLYIAAHDVEDRVAPFLGFVPLAAAPGSDEKAAILEPTDVRALDLSACRLAVLASCASGAPCRGASEPGPSLGDAFLDAGARAVVTSFWDVGDDETREFMQRFLAERRLGEDPIGALSQARREAMCCEGLASPRVWAVWSIALVRPRASAREADRYRMVASRWTSVSPDTSSRTK